MRKTHGGANYTSKYGIMILLFDLYGSANICFHWNILSSADPCGASLEGRDMLEMPSTRLLLIKSC